MRDVARVDGEATEAGGHAPGLMEADGAVLYILEPTLHVNRVSAEVKRGYTSRGLVQPAEVHETARRMAAAWNACIGVDTDTLEGMGARAMERARDRYHVERMAAIRLRAAAGKLLDAFGGDVPDWLRAMASELREASDRSEAVATGNGRLQMPADRVATVMAYEALCLTVSVFDRVAQGESFNDVCEETGCTASVIAARRAMEAQAEEPGDGGAAVGCGAGQLEGERSELQARAH